MRFEFATLSLAEVRDQCQDSLANSRFEIDEPPHTVTHCPSNNKPDKGKKPF